MSRADVPPIPSAPWVREPVSWWILVGPALAGGLAVVAAVAALALPLAHALPAVATLTVAGALRAVSRRRDVPFLIEHFGLQGELSEIWETRCRVVRELRSLAARGIPGVWTDVPSQLDELAGRAFTLALTSRRLKRGRQLVQVDRELTQFDRRCRASSGDDGDEYLERTREHLRRERAAIVELGQACRRLEAQLSAIRQFFRSTDTEVQALVAHFAAIGPRDGTDPESRARDLIGSVRDVEVALREIDGRIDEAVRPRKQALLPPGARPDATSTLVQALERLGVPVGQTGHAAQELTQLLTDLETVGPDGTLLREGIASSTRSLAGQAEPADRLGFFANLLRLALEDGKVVPQENRFLVRLAQLLGLDRETCDALARQARLEHATHR